MLKRFCFGGALFVIILGSLAHFFYNWSENNVLIGLFTPVNESTWEHMKLVFFPMLIFSIFAYFKLKKEYSCILSALLSGILIGTILIPIVFYTYSGILGMNNFFLDIATFIFAVVVSFISIYKSAQTCRFQKFTSILYWTVLILILCFFIFTIAPPQIGLFAEP